MQVVYNKKNINLNYLNAYVKSFIDDDYLYLYNTLYNKKLILKSSNNNLKELLVVLHRGTNYRQLIKILQKISDRPKNLYEYLLQNFIVEWGVVMKKELLKKFNIDNNFYVNDIFVFTNESNKYSFLLNKNGCSMIVDEEFL